MGKVGAEEVLALREEVEGELLYVSFRNDIEQNPIEGVFPDVLGDPEVEEELEGQRKQEVGQEDHRELVVEEFEVVGEESQSLRIFVKRVNISVFFLVLNTLQNSIINPCDGSAN